MSRDYTDAVPFPDTISLRPIGVVRAPYTERHNTPRQPGLEGPMEQGSDAISELVLFPELLSADALRDLERFDRVWVISLFHLNGPLRKALVRPPRGGPARGVLATRAPHRPNPIGLSCAPLVEVRGHTVALRGLDLLDGTPVLDIKPYIPDFDAFPAASRGWLDDFR